MSGRQDSYSELGGPDFLSIERSGAENLKEYEEGGNQYVSRKKFETDLEVTFQDDDSSTVYTPDNNAIVFGKGGATIVSVEDIETNEGVSDIVRYSCAKLDQNTNPTSDEVAEEISAEVIEVVEEHLS